MVRINEPKKEDDAITSALFLSSINSWYKDDGIKVGVERVGNLYPNKNDKNKRGVAVTLSILDDMKCRARVIGDDGKVVMVEDEDTGEDKPKITKIEDPDEVTFFFNVRKEDDEKNEFSEDNTKGFICDIDELKNSLNGLEFIAKAKKESFSGGKPYWVIIPSAVKSYDVEEVE